MSGYQFSKRPSQDVLRRLYRNKPAFLGLLVIIIAHIIAVLGYSIMPDKTPNATRGALEIKKLPPISTVVWMKFRKGFKVEQKNLFGWLYSGQESEYTYTPIMGTPRFDKDSIFFKPYPGSGSLEIGYPIVRCVRAVDATGSTGYTYDEVSGVITYPNLDGDLETARLEDLKNEFDVNNVEQVTFWLGTDSSGRDVLSRLLYGTHISLQIGLISVLISLLIGVTVGAVAGFFGGKVDAALMWLMTVIWSIPSIMMVVAISIALQSKGVWVTFLAVGLTMWVDIARLIRGQILSIKEKVYVEAARALGFTGWRIIFRHILPNVIDPLIVACTSNFAAAILIEAGLSFLGLGVQYPAPSWGNMIKEGYELIATPDSWHMVVFPSLAISTTVLAFNLLGNGLRDAFDPYSRQR